MLQPVWYIKQQKEIEEGTRHDWPCNGVITERTYGYMNREDNYKVLE